MRAVSVSGPLHITRPRANERAPRTAPPGRTCKQRGCRTRLSIYNLDPYCSIHANLSHPKTRKPGLKVVAPPVETAYALDERVAAVFKAHPGEWLFSFAIMRAAGCTIERTFYNCIKRLRDREGMLIEGRKGMHGGFRLVTDWTPGEEGRDGLD